jgi:hypothetical protein
MTVNRRVAKPRTGTKINGGKGIIIRAADVTFPTYEHRIKFDYDGKEAFLVIVYQYEPEHGYTVTGAVEVDGERLDNKVYYENNPYDAWHDYIHVHFVTSYMANRYSYEVPKTILALIEKRMEFQSALEG